MKYGIFTKEQHVEKIVNHLNLNTDIKYIISTNRWEPSAFDFDIGVSYCFPWLIDLKAPENKNRIWYNYHPSPLPEFGDWGHWVRGLKRIKETGELLWGVSLALIDEGIDTGPELKTRWFHLDTIPVNTQELADITHYYLFQLFKQTIVCLRDKPVTKEQMDLVC
jgi:methionyl-tRNA formyltransferase